MSTEPSHSQISQRVLTWFDRCGRKDLPWQQDINPYRVWVSEIMLQQTQVNTVIPYFERFMQEFATIEELARASDDQVMHRWTGLGYYSRARNLHKTAITIVTKLGGQFPDTVAQLCELPGIGRSTAGAIVSIAFRRPAAILDGNVKRVLARYHAVAGWPGQSQVAKQLWHYAELHTPRQRTADYSQAMMDLGATLCTRSKPACPLCPLRTNCLAYQQDKTLTYPGKKPQKTLPVKTAVMLLIQNTRGEILLEKRPPSGIWGGLWAFPQLQTGSDIQQYCLDRYGETVLHSNDWQTFRHTFSHFHLDIKPVLIQLKKDPAIILEADRQLWYNLQHPKTIGLATPIKRLMDTLNQAPT
jgi:A/G-specific adenine glycosylase